MLQEQVTVLQRFLQRNRVEFPLIFALAVQPCGKSRERRRVGAFPIGDSARDQSFPLRGIDTFE